jgi:hypothetical protein
MMMIAVLMPAADAARKYERWLRRPHEWAFWRAPSRSFQVPLPSVWGLEPVRRLAASVELTGRLCAPVPASAFHAFAPSQWYEKWLRMSVKVDNRAAEDGIRRFPQLLARHSPVALIEARVHSDADALPREIGPLRKEAEALRRLIEASPRWRTYSVEWASCRLLIDILDRKQCVVFFPHWPAQVDEPVRFHELPARGLHRVRSVAIVDRGEAVDVRFVNGATYRVTATDALVGGRRIAAAIVGRRSATVVLTNELGVETELAPARLLAIARHT